MGRFEIRGQFGQATLALVAQNKDLIGEPVIVRAGSNDVRLVIGKAGRLEGRLLLDASLADEMIVAQLERENRASTRSIASGPRPSAVDHEGRFAIMDLRPGDYALHVVHAASGQVLASIHELKVTAGETTRDRRLDPLDLRAKHRIIELELVDSSGTNVSHARAFSRASGADNDQWTYAQGTGGRLPILYDGRPLDIAIVAAGFQTVELERMRASQRVTLRRSAKLRLRLAPGLRAPDPPLYLGVRLKPTEVGRYPSFLDAGAGEFDANGELTCKFGASGPVQVDLVVTLRQSGSASVDCLSMSEPNRIQVDEGEAEQAFDIRFDPLELEERARVLRGRQ